MLPLVVAVTLGWNPLDEGGAILDSDLSPRPWAKYTGTVSETTAYKCTGEGNYGLAYPIPISSSLWKSAYVPIQRNIDDDFYLMASSKAFYVCDSNPLTATTGSTIPAGVYTLYHRCDPGGTTGPTSAPTQAPTANPTTIDEFDWDPEIYGPRNVSECIEMGGDAGDWDYSESYSNGVHRVRYCNIPICDQHFASAAGGWSNACPPTPWEIQVRNNGGECTPCPDNPYPTMVYCDDTPGCNDTFDGATCGNGALFYDACPKHFTNTGHHPYTPAPTSAPTPLLTLDHCWTYDDSGCTNIGATWCQSDDFKTYANYTINNPVSGLVDMRAATIEDFLAIDNADDRTQLAGVVVNIINVILGSVDFTENTCWCTEQNLNWLPYGLVSYSEGAAKIASLSYTSSRVPLPRSFLGGANLVDHVFMSTVQYPTIAAAYIQNISDTVYSVIASDLRTDMLAPALQNCQQRASDGCQPLDYIVRPTEPMNTLCRFVCVDMFYVENYDTVRYAPLTVAWRTSVKNSTACGTTSRWVNGRILQPLLLYTQWQKYASVVGYRGTFQSTPWLNFTKISQYDPDSTNCKLPAEKFCSIQSTGYGSAHTWYCDLVNLGNTSAYNLYDSINYAGMDSFSTKVNTHDCDTNPEGYDIELVIPDILFSDLPGTVPVNYRSIVRDQLYDLSWRVFLLSEDDCTDSANYSVTYNGDGDTFVATINLEWVDVTGQTGCIGQSGCADLLSDCQTGTDVPGCIYVSGTTQTTTTGSQTLGTLGSFPPTLPTSAPGTGARYDAPTSSRDASLVVALIGAFLIFALVAVNLLLRKHGERVLGDNEEYQPFMMG